MAKSNKVSEPSKKNEITTVRTIRITVVTKVPNDEVKAHKIVEKDQERILKNLIKMGVDNVEVLSTKSFENFSDNTV